MCQTTWNAVALGAIMPATLSPTHREIALRTSLLPKLCGLACAVAACAGTTAMWPSGALAQTSGWIQIANEEENYHNLSVNPITMRYGAGSSFTYRIIPGMNSSTNSGACSTYAFADGVDPAPGVPKHCEVQGYWQRVATEGQTFLGAYGLIRYGATVSGVPDYVHAYFTPAASNRDTCSNTTFGVDPAPGVVKACDLAVLTPA